MAASTDELMDGFASEREATFDWTPLESERDLEVRLPNGTQIEMGRSVQNDFESQYEEHLPAFMIGCATRDTPVQWSLDLGEGRKECATTRAGFYVNPICGGAYVRQTGTVEVNFAGMPLSGLAHLVGLSPAAVEYIVRPLHDGMVEDAFVPPLMEAMWQQAGQGAVHASIFLDQAMTTAAFHTFALARGPGWMRLPGLEWAEDGRMKRRLISDGENTSLDDARIARAIDYIEAHLGDAITVSDIASAAASSPSHLSRAFRASTGESVWNFVLQRRLLRAETMLRDTNMAIARIAYCCGFSDQAHMTRLFRKELDRTPRQVRLEDQAAA